MIFSLQFKLLFSHFPNQFDSLISAFLNQQAMFIHSSVQFIQLPIFTPICYLCLCLCAYFMFSVHPEKLFLNHFSGSDHPTDPRATSCLPHHISLFFSSHKNNSGCNNNNNDDNTQNCHATHKIHQSFVYRKIHSPIPFSSPPFVLVLINSRDCRGLIPPPFLSLQLFSILISFPSKTRLFSFFFIIFCLFFLLRNVLFSTPLCLQIQ